MSSKPIETERCESAFGAGALRLAAVLHSEDGLVIDGLVDRLSPLGSVGDPVTLVVSESGMGVADYRLLWDWLAADAVVDIAVPMGAVAQRVVDLRNGEDELRLAIVGISS